MDKKTLNHWIRKVNQDGQSELLDLEDSLAFMIQKLQLAAEMMKDQMIGEGVAFREKPTIWELYCVRIPIPTDYADMYDLAYIVLSHIYLDAIGEENQLDELREKCEADDHIWVGVSVPVVV